MIEAWLNEPIYIGDTPILQVWHVVCIVLVLAFGVAMMLVTRPQHPESRRYHTQVWTVVMVTTVAALIVAGFCLHEVTLAEVEAGSGHGEQHVQQEQQDQQDQQDQLEGTQQVEDDTTKAEYELQSGGNITITIVDATSQ